MHVCYCQRFATRSFSGSFEMSSDEQTGGLKSILLTPILPLPGRSPSRASEVPMMVERMSLGVHCIGIDWYRSVCLCNSM